jgi:hypothetical protein
VHYEDTREGGARFIVRVPLTTIQRRGEASPAATDRHDTRADTQTKKLANQAPIDL